MFLNSFFFTSLHVVVLPVKGIACFSVCKTRKVVNNEIHRDEIYYKIRALEKLEVDRRLERLSEEVEQKIAGQVGRLQAELERKAAELETARQESARLGREKEELEERASELSRQVDVSVELLASLKQDLVHKEQELSRKQQ